MAQKTVLLINGPNLNLLGYREPHIYGSTTLADVESKLRARCEELSSSGGDTPSEKITLLSYHSNSCGQIIDRIHAAFHANLKASKPVGSSLSPTATAATTSSPDPNSASIEGPVDAIIINPGGLTHTSVALRDALAGISVPFVEVHVSNIHAREEFRHKSFLSEKAAGVVCGLGTFGYLAALEFLVGEGGHLKK